MYLKWNICKAGADHDDDKEFLKWGIERLNKTDLGHGRITATLMYACKHK